MTKTSPLFITIFLVIAGVFVSQSKSKSLQKQRSQALFDGPHCFLTLNEICNVTRRELELNWRNFKNFQKGDWIGLFDYDPSVQDDCADHVNDALAKFNIASPNGLEKTSVQLAVENFTVSVNEERCHTYYVGYFQLGQPAHPISSNCFRLYPTWMNDLKDTIGDTPLHLLMLPGTHDAGAWLVCSVPNAGYLHAQEENIHNQLVAGIRYLDIRAAHNPSDPNDVFWVNHDIFPIRPMRTVLADIKEFVRETNEIVFLDFHRFPKGFDSDTIHDEFFTFLKGYLENYMAPKNLGSDVTLNQLWTAGRNIIVTYAHHDYEILQELLWPKLNQAWGDKNTIEALEDYLPQAIQQNKCKGRFWSLMAELTPTTLDVFTNKNGLRGMANEVNKLLNSRYTNRTWYSKSNIVATDFFFRNNIIETSITVIKNRGVKCSC